MKTKLVFPSVALLCMLCFSCGVASAQRWSIGINVVDYLNMGTINAESSVAVAQHYSFNAGVRFNPWTLHYGDEEKQFENRKKCMYAGFRFWPWHIYSGWWAGLQLQYQEYNRGGGFIKQAEEGDAYGVGVSLGYTLMIHKSFNIEFGAGAWAGGAVYTAYSCPYCGTIVDQGNKFFFWPNNVMVSLVYIL